MHSSYLGSLTTRIFSEESLLALSESVSYRLIFLQKKKTENKTQQDVPLTKKQNIWQILGLFFWRTAERLASLLSPFHWLTIPLQCNNPALSPRICMMFTIYISHSLPYNPRATISESYNLEFCYTILNNPWAILCTCVCVCVCVCVCGVWLSLLKWASRHTQF
jgi:hypothetical protein